MQFKSNMGCFYVLFLVAISIHNSCQHPVFDVPSQEEDNRQDEGEALTEEDFKNALTEVYSDDDVPDEDQSAELFEGDIELSDEDRKAFEEGGVTGLREVVGLSIRKWPKGGDGHVTVPYYIPSGMAKSKRSAIARVVLEYQTKTCIRLVPKEGNKRHYIKFLDGDRGLVCSSPLGMQYGYQSINFGMCSWGSLAHEVMHSLGFFHEHTRSDRDQYITINWDNIPDEFKHNFAPCTSYHEGCNDLNVGYDYDSIMHYGKRITGTKADQITPKDPGAEIGQRKRLSEKDVEGLNEYYECDPGSIDTTTQIEDSNCPPDKLLENGCEKWASYGMCGGTWMDENCPTSCNSC